MCFPLNGLEFCMFLYHIYSDLWKKVQKRIFIYFIWIKDEGKKCYKVWFVKRSCVIVIYEKFYTLYRNAMHIWRPTFKPCYQQPNVNHMFTIYGLYVDYILTIYKFYFDKIIKSILYCKNMANSLIFLCNGIEIIFIEILNELGHTPYL
jgi:hypothetical protein